MGRKHSKFIIVIAKNTLIQKVARCSEIRESKYYNKKVLKNKFVKKIFAILFRYDGFKLVLFIAYG